MNDFYIRAEKNENGYTLYEDTLMVCIDYKPNCIMTYFAPSMIEYTSNPTNLDDAKSTFAGWLSL